MRYLKQNTMAYITIGPVLDKTDGVTNEDGLTVTNFSGVIMKETHATATTHTDFTPSATAATAWGMSAIGHGGFYQLRVPAAEINFVGSAMIGLWYTAEALPMWAEFMVIPANVYDSMMGTDLLDINVSKINETSQTAADIGSLVLTIRANTPATAVSDISTIKGNVAIIKANTPATMNTDITAIKGNVITIKSNTPATAISDIATIKLDIGIIKANTPATLGTDISIIKANVAMIKANTPATMVSDIATIKSNIATIKSNTPATLASNVEAIKSDVAVIKSNTPATLDSNIATIKLDIGIIKANTPATMNTDIGLIKAKTDKMTFTSGNDLDVNVQKINDVTIVGNGTTVPMGA